MLLISRVWTKQLAARHHCRYTQSHDWTAGTLLHLLSCPDCSSSISFTAQMDSGLFCTSRVAHNLISGLTFADLAAATGKDEVYIAAVCYGAAKPSLEVLAKLSDKLDFAKDALAAPGVGLGKEFYPVRGCVMASFASVSMSQVHGHAHSHFSSPGWLDPTPHANTTPCFS